MPPTAGYDKDSEEINTFTVPASEAPWTQIESGANGTICSKETWITIGKPKLQPVEAQYKVADGNRLQVLGQFEIIAELDGKTGGIDLKVV